MTTVRRKLKVDCQDVFERKNLLMGVSGGKTKKQKNQTQSQIIDSDFLPKINIGLKKK